jgi:hypothetical protein
MPLTDATRSTMLWASTRTPTACSPRSLRPVASPAPPSPSSPRRLTPAPPRKPQPLTAKQIDLLETSEHGGVRATAAELIALVVKDNPPCQVAPLALLLSVFLYHSACRRVVARERHTTLQAQQVVLFFFWLPPTPSACLSGHCQDTPCQISALDR